MSLAREAIRIVLAASRPIFRSSLSLLLSQQSDLTVVATAADGQQALNASLRLVPDILIADIDLSRLPVLEVLRQAERRAPKVKAILLAHEIRSEQILEAMELGARGIVLHDSSVDLLFKSIRCVMAGEYWIGRDRVTDALAHLRRARQLGQRGGNSEFNLTGRELEIVHAVLSAWSNKEIADRYEISQNTVKHHLTSIFGKTGAANRLDLAVLAINRGLMKPGPSRSPLSRTLPARSFSR